MAETLTKAHTALTDIRSLAKLETRSDSGTTLSGFKGGVEFRDVAFGYPDTAIPIVESLSLKLEPGAVMVAAGQNGAGKTTMARLLVGLLEPKRGQILIDGVDIRQLSPDWWHRQIMYLPQEPKFLNGTIRDNLAAINTDLNDQQLHEYLERAGLAEFIDRSEAGLDTAIVANGLNLSVGHRRRLALARATNGKFVIFDEPTEALDSDGSRAVHQVIKTLSKEGRTIIACTNDPALLASAGVILDLNQKPVPRVLHRPVAQTEAAPEEAS